MLLTKNGVVEAIVVGRIEEQRIVCNIGYKTLYKPKARVLYVEYGGILGNHSYANLCIILSEITSSLKKGEADIACFSGLRLDSDIYRLAKSEQAFFLRDYFAIPFEHWKMTLPPTIEGFQKTMSSKHRYWLRRMQRLLQEENTEEIVYKFFYDHEEVDRFCRDAEEVAKTSYQRGLGVGFADNGEMRKRLELSAEQKWLRGNIVYIGDKPIAFWLATLYGKTLYLDATGYNPSYRKYEPGTILFNKLIESIFYNDDGVEEIDFGFGDAFYKERYGNQHWQETSVYLFSFTFKSIKINAIRSLVMILSLFAERILKYFNLTARVKKLWRKKMVPLS